MAAVLLVTPHTSPDPFLLAGLAHHDVTVCSGGDQILTESASADIVVVDGRADPTRAKAWCGIFTTAGVAVLRMVILSEQDLPTYSPEWGCSEFLVDTASHTEFQVRLEALTTAHLPTMSTITVGAITIDVEAYGVTLDDQPLDLTLTEFELLKYLALHPWRVFSRKQLLTEVWGHDYYGGTRTVDVHIRRLRAKLGPDHETHIDTVRNIGYRLVTR